MLSAISTPRDLLPTKETPATVSIEFLGNRYYFLDVKQIISRNPFIFFMGRDKLSLLSSIEIERDSCVRIEKHFFAESIADQEVASAVTRKFSRE